MDYANYNPTCPNCGTDLDFDDHYDMYDEGDVIICKVHGHCPHCKKNYQWEDVYALDGFQCLEETE